MVIAGKPIPPKKLKGAPKKASDQTDALKKADLDKNLKDKKNKLKGKTKDLMSALKQSTKVEMFVKGVESVKQLREKIKSAPIGMIEKLEDKYPGLTLAAFTTHLKDSFKLNIKGWSSDAIYSKFKPNTKYKINFLGNQDAEDKWGWADMASIEWRGMTKYEGGNANKKRVSKRRIGLKGQNKAKRGCYDNRGYMAIHTNDEVMYHSVESKFKTQFREKDGDKYKEVNAKSYELYAKSKFASEDTKFMEKNKSNWTFISKRPSITPQFIREVRAKIGPLTGLSIPQRIAKVARYLAISENNIGGRHCGDWVDRVYAIAGVKRRKSIYANGLKYALVDGDRKKGWKPKSDPSRYDVRLSGPRAYASDRKLDQLQVGDWVWINNRNRYDYAGNHSGIFLGWEGDKKDRRAIIACWFGNKKGRQKITTYNFKNMPVTNISRAVEVDESLPDSNAPATKLAAGRESAEPGIYTYREVPGLPESERRAEWDPNYFKSTERATKAAYLKVATKMAKKACAGTPLNWRVMLAQSILETGWGTSSNARNMRNYFGIMAHELKNPKQRDRAYKTMYESFMDYRNKMLTNSRYKDVLEYKDNPMMQLAVLLGKGYCTTPGYFKKIVSVWKTGVYGPSIGIPSTAKIDESELRSILSDSEVNDSFIEREFLKPAKDLGRYQA